MILLLADAKGKEIYSGVVSKGSFHASEAPVRKIIDLAMRYNATTAAIAHNHPSGIALPSPEDVQTTRRVAAALNAVEIALADHIVVADDDYVSMVQSGYRFDDCVIH